MEAFLRRMVGSGAEIKTLDMNAFKSCPEIDDVTTEVNI
jgi:hypothetical protein